MGHVDVSHLEYYLPDGRVLFDDVSFRVGQGAVVALVGANGAGKTTLLQLVAGDLHPHGGTVTVDGDLGVMRQFIGTSGRGDQESGALPASATVRQLLVSVSPAPIRRAAETLERAERHLARGNDEKAQVDFAQALADWGEAAGYEAEIATGCRAAGPGCGPSPARAWRWWG